MVEPIRMLLEFYPASDHPDGDYDLLMYVSGIGFVPGFHQLGHWCDCDGYELDVTPNFWARLPEDGHFAREP